MGATRRTTTTTFAMPAAPDGPWAARMAAGQCSDRRTRAYSGLLLLCRIEYPAFAEHEGCRVVSRMHRSEHTLFFKHTEAPLVRRAHWQAMGWPRPVHSLKPEAVRIWIRFLLSRASTGGQEADPPLSATARASAPPSGPPAFAQLPSSPAATVVHLVRVQHHNLHVILLRIL